MGGANWVGVTAGGSVAVGAAVAVGGTLVAVAVGEGAGSARQALRNRARVASRAGNKQTLCNRFNSLHLLLVLHCELSF